MVISTDSGKLHSGNWNSTSDFRPEQWNNEHYRSFVSLKPALDSSSEKNASDSKKEKTDSPWLAKVKFLLSSED